MKIITFFAGFVILLALVSQPALGSGATVEQYHKLFYENQQTWPQNKWLGVPTLQNPNDMWITQEIITELAPDLIIEAGTFKGGSACIWAMVLKQINPKGKVVTIDIEPLWKKEKQPAIWKEVEFILGSSVDPKILKTLEARARGKKVLVLLDSDHSKNHVLNELNAYAPMVSKGSYLIVQDSNINGHPVAPKFGPGPYEAISDFLNTPAGKSFNPDKSRERLMLTFAPNGYLKKVN